MRPRRLRELLRMGPRPGSPGKAEARDVLIVETVAQMLGADPGLDATLDALAHSAKRVLCADRATVYLFPSTPGSVVESVHTTERDPALRRTIEQSIGTPLAKTPIGSHLESLDDPSGSSRMLRAARWFRLALRRGLAQVHSSASNSTIRRSSARKGRAFRAACSSPIASPGASAPTTAGWRAASGASHRCRSPTRACTRPRFGCWRTPRSGRRPTR